MDFHLITDDELDNLVVMYKKIKNRHLKKKFGFQLSVLVHRSSFIIHSS